MCMGELSSEQSVLININTKMTSIMDGINIIKEKQEELGRDIGKIKEAMYNPDQGLYARHAQLEARLQSLENWKASNTKIVWSIVSITVAMVMNTIWGMIVGTQ